MQFYFRANKSVMLNDIGLKQAFLMVRLKNKDDQNRFCFSWKRENKFVTYLYI